jgi:hypothetical protein
VPLILSLPTSAPATSYSSVLVFSSPCYGTTANKGRKKMWNSGTKVQILDPIVGNW